MVQATPRHCPRCNTPFTENQRICARCGFTLDALLSGINAPQEPYPGQPVAQFSSPSNAASPSPQPPQVSQYPLPPTPQQVSQHPLPPASQQVSLHPQLAQQQQDLQHLETMPPDEIPTLAQPAVRPISSPQLASQQDLQHSETMPPDEIPTLIQPAVQPISSPQLAPSQYAQYPETAQPTAQPVSPPQKRSKRLGLIVLVLLILVILGGAGYGGYAYFAHRAPSQTPITTITIHSTAISYAGVDVTILNVQRSQIFLDDPNVADNSIDQTSSALVRLNLQAQNTTTTPVNMIYGKIARLVLPGGRIVDPIYVKSIPAITPGMTQAAKIDFVVPATSKTEQLVLRLGASDEAQLDIPLTANADMSMYGPKTEQMSGTVVYQGLSWSLVNATTQLSVDGQQASNGMHFVIVTLKVDNTLEQSTITGSPFDYLRLKAENTTASPLNSTLPLMFAKGDKGKTGMVTFMVPQNATALTLLFQQTNGFDAQTLAFHL